MKYPYIFFDLDGTLTDPGEGIVNCVRYALESFGMHETDDAKLTRFIGPPLIQSFRDYYGFDEEQAALAVAKYRERFSTVGLFENHVYDGIYDVLKTLIEGGHTLVLATSKPKVFADRIMEKYGLAPYFTLMCGSELDGTRVNKKEVIDYAIELLACPRDGVIMVGDRKHDILGAAQCGVASCGVRYGYAEAGELEAAGADFIVDAPSELVPVLMQA